MSKLSTKSFSSVVTVTLNPFSRRAAPAFLLQVEFQEVELKLLELLHGEKLRAEETDKDGKFLESSFVSKIVLSSFGIVELVLLSRLNFIMKTTPP